jgi:hypothetical protein
LDCEFGKQINPSSGIYKELFEDLYNSSEERETLRPNSPEAIPTCFPHVPCKDRNREAESLKVKIFFEYRAPDILYYLEAGKYIELKYKLRSSELYNAWSSTWISSIIFAS